MTAKKKKVGVVLGSGGIRALAALPFLEILQKIGVPIDLIVGSEGGAVMGALYSAGFPLEDIPRYMAEIYQRTSFGKINYYKLYKTLRAPLDPKDGPPGLLNNFPLKSRIEAIFKDIKIENLKTRTIIHATNMKNGSIVPLEEGSLTEAVYASNVVYPFLPPQFYKDQWLAGGMYTAVLPLMTAVNQQMDVIFAVSVNELEEVQQRGFIEHSCTLLNRTFASIQSPQVTLAISIHDGEIMMINVKFKKSIYLWDTHAIQDILEAGKTTVEKFAAEIDDIVKNAVNV